MPERLAFDGFSVVMPQGWDVVDDDSTFSDPDQPPPATFARSEGAGAVYVQPILFQAHLQPSDETAEVEGLAFGWGARRGLTRPLASGSTRGEHGCLATATYRLADDFVQVWFLSDGGSVLHASYVCPWSARDDERGGREALVDSLRFC